MGKSKWIFVLVVGLLLFTGCVRVSVEDKEALSTTPIICPCVEKVVACPLVVEPKTILVEKVVVKEVPKVVVKEVIKEVIVIREMTPMTTIVTKNNIHNNIHPKVDIKVNNHPKVSNK